MQAPFRVKDRREAGLDVHDAVVVHILHHLIRDALERFFGLHDAAGVGESFQIERQASALCPPLEPNVEFAGIRRRQFVVADVLGELNDCLRANAAVEMIVKKNLGKRP